MKDFKVYDEDGWEFMPVITREWMLQVCREAHPAFVVNPSRIYVVQYQPGILAWKVAWPDIDDIFTRADIIGHYHEEVVVLAKWADCINKEVHYIGIGLQSHALVVAQK